ncbi:hypothetical protein [Prolixibacter sp. NT017]|uniref:hypothetical protein n=1 Tax=Prolixibacter sp. NT017 TaxID=2652390 RepID=UPI001279F497|nr:hypothetical protein [Prolixibacter sp. NT017]GET25386.1 hypothetical protein NT017_17150 [Prolixibacter sp. NT017]
MQVTIDNVNYKAIIASDLQRDGIGIELHNADKNQFIAEIFRNDKLRKIQFNSTDCQLPLEVLKQLIEEFETCIGREYQD